MFRLFDLFRSTKPVNEVMANDQEKEWKELPFIEVLRMNKEEYEQYIRDSHKHFIEKEDFLGFAAKAKHEALTAVRAKRYDDAWRLFHEQKLYYMKYAAKQHFTRLQTLALDGDVSEDLANVLRLEGKHSEALTHIIYWVASSSRKLKRHDSKLQAYFGRAKLQNAEFSELQRFIHHIRSNPEFAVIQSQVRRW